MAFTATKDVPLAATTTGSWPRPAWYTQSLWGRPLDTAMLDPIYREQFSDALAHSCFGSGARRPRYCDMRRLLPRCGSGRTLLASLSVAALARRRL